MTAHSDPQDQVVSVGPAATSSTAGAITVGHRLYISTQYLWSAQHLAHLASNREAEHVGGPDFSIHVRAYCLASISATVSFLESFINELLEDTRAGDSSYLDNVSADKQKELATWWDENRKRRGVGIPDKFSQVQFVITGEQLNKGVRPWQDVDLVLDLRNRLHHYFPTTLSITQPHELEGRLQRQGFPANRTMENSRNPWFPDEALGAGCATWGLETARDFVDEFVDRLGISAHYRVAQNVDPST